MRNVIYKPRVIVGMDQENIPLLIVGSKTIHDKWVANANVLSNPSPTMAVFLGQITDLDTAQQATKVSRGAVGARNQKRDIVWSSIGSLRSILQLLCDNNPEMAATYADMGGMVLAKHPQHAKSMLDVLLLPTKGDVELRANAKLLIAAAGKTAGTKKTFLWRHMVAGTNTWVLDDPTPVGRTVVHGLPLNVEVGFQVAIKDSKGPGEWSQTVTELIH